MLDPTIGRWWQVDPMVDELYSWTPYNYSFNNPIRYNDPKGDCPLGVDCEAMAEGGWNALKAVGQFAADTWNSKGENLVQAAKNVNALATLAHGAPEFAGELVANAAKQNFVEKIQEHGSANGSVSAAMGEVAVGVLLSAATDKGLSKLGSLAKVADKVGDALPDNANVVRGGTNTPELIQKGTGTHPSGVTGVSVECGTCSVKELSKALPQYNKVETTTVSAVRKAGGDVIKTSGRSQNHATMTGLSPQKASELLKPIIKNPSKE